MFEVVSQRLQLLHKRQVKKGGGESRQKANLKKAKNWARVNPKKKVLGHRFGEFSWQSHLHA